MSGSTDTMAKRVFEAIGKSDLFFDPRFSSNAARLAHDEELDAMVAQFMLQRSQDDCLKHFRQHGVTVGPIYASPQLIQDAHVVQRGVYIQCDAGDGAEPTVMHQVTPRLQGTPGSIRRAAPLRGQHTEELLTELGANPQERQSLKTLGAMECR
jgi:crotonobetainyl-CoA:carnitine CoA-transferase CaiB-like acyl-CoA transferase